MFLAREHELYRWTTDQQIIEAVTPDGLAIGQMNVARLGAEIENLVALGVYEQKPDWLAMLDATVVPKLYEGNELIWASMN